jgi:hypothetical protein
VKELPEEELEIELVLELEGVKEGAGLKEERFETGLKDGLEITIGLEEEEEGRMIVSARINLLISTSTPLNSLELNGASTFRWSKSK